MHIGNFDTKNKILLVAEIGNNHEGNFDIAKQLVHKAKEAGADAVKFQTFKTEHYVSSTDTARFARLKSFELSHPQFAELAGLAHSLGLLFISTPFDLQSAEFLAGIVDCFKIASGDNNFLPLLARVAKTGKPMIISTGLSDLAQVESTVGFVEREWKKHGINGDLAILHCISSYPVPPEEASLGAIPFLASKLNYTVGYSDHTIGVEAASIAAALGARIIEKHFTLDKNFSEFRDHQLSADQTDFQELVRRVRLVSVAVGEHAKNLQPCETANIKSLRRSIVAGRDMKQGQRLENNDFTWIRLAGGLAPGNEERLIGKTLQRDIHFGELILESDVV